MTPKFSSIQSYLFILLLILSAFAPAGCGIRHALTYDPVIMTHTDTLYMNRSRYDSIYIDHRQLTDRSRDTIYIEKSRIEYRYRTVSDTVRVVERDSIPVVREVEAVRTERHTPWICRVSPVIVTIIFFSVLYIRKKMMR